MQHRRVQPNLTPAEARRRHNGLMRQERMLEDELKMVTALVELVVAETLDREGPAQSPRQIQALFPHRADRAMTSGVLARVLTRAGVAGNPRVFPYQVVEAVDRIDSLADSLREDLREVRRDLGKE